MRFTMKMVLSAFLMLAGAAQTWAIEGRHKIVVLAFGEDEFAIVDISKDSGKLVSVQDRLLPNAKMGKVLQDKGEIVLEITTDLGPNMFQSVRENGESVKGTFTFRGTKYAAELVPTKEEKVAAMKSGQVMQEMISILRPVEGQPQKSPKEMAGGLKGLIEKYQGKPYVSSVYSQLMSLSDAAEMSEDEVRKTVDQWLSSAREYGEDWYNQTKSTVVKSLRGKKKAAAGVLLDLAQDLDKSLNDDADIEQKAEVAAILVETARSLGKNDLADTVQKRMEGYEAKLDESYHDRVPPFKPEKVVEKQDVRPVVMELFTGAQCPPCVAADVGFDALADTYSHKNVILLQYHLHIPGPDPLTNNDTISRQKYYGALIRGTPTTIFNGKSEAGGGGSMAGSEGKYKQFRGVIDPILETKPIATVDLKATRKGDVIEVIANAKTKDKPGEKSVPRLRVVLTEESVKYVGSNKLRFHHHVVRAIPTGPDGITLSKDGKLDHNLKIDLNQVRSDIETYVSDFEKNRPFFGTKPAIDLKKLSVVAFIQDDESKEILGASSVEVVESP
ncbi:MAG: hypothetical protein RJA81_959 [Planctomycetota bacterium]